jgi:hypothetical protein
VALTLTVAVIAPAASVAVDVPMTAPLVPTTCTLNVPAVSPDTLKAPVAAVVALPTTAPAAFTTSTVTPANAPEGPLTLPAMIPIASTCAKLEDNCEIANMTARAIATTRFIGPPI